MGRLIIVFLLALVCIPSASAADKGFAISPSDVFPSCVMGKDSDFSSMVRCGCEFLVPNFHIQGLANMFIKEILALFNLFGTPFELVGNALYVTPDYISCGVYQVQQKLDGKATWDEVVACPMLTKEWKSPVDVVISAVFGVITPFLVMVFLFTLSFTQTYLILGLAFTGWTLVIKKGTPSPKEGLLVIIFGLIILAAGSIWLLGSDLGLYAPLVVI